jgi:hypothetical protein
MRAIAKCPSFLGTPMCREMNACQSRLDLSFFKRTTRKLGKKILKLNLGFLAAPAAIFVTGK